MNVSEYICTCIRERGNVFSQLYMCQTENGLLLLFISAGRFIGGVSVVTPTIFFIVHNTTKNQMNKTCFLH